VGGEYPIMDGKPYAAFDKQGYISGIIRGGRTCISLHDASIGKGCSAHPHKHSIMFVTLPHWMAVCIYGDCSGIMRSIAAEPLCMAAILDGGVTFRYPRALRALIPDTYLQRPHTPVQQLLAC